MWHWWQRFTEYVDATQIPAQLRAVDVHGLFTNPWFLVPFVLYLGYLLYRQAMTQLAVTGIVVGMWIFTGTSWMQGLVVNGELDLGKVLPVAGVWLAAVVAVVYLLFMRSD